MSSVNIECGVVPQANGEPRRITPFPHCEGARCLLLLPRSRVVPFGGEGPVNRGLRWQRGRGIEAAKQ